MERPHQSRLAPIVEETETIDRQYVDVDAKLVVSFPAQWGGTPFVEHLHQLLTSQYGLRSSTKVYVDSVAARILPATALTKTFREHVPTNPALLAHRNPATLRDTQTASIRRGIDPRPSMRLADGTSPSSVRREDWNVLFDSAIRSSRLFLIVLTRHYLASQWCRQEIAQANEENARRASLTGAERTAAFRNGTDQPLRFVALSLGLPGDNDKAALKALVPNVTVVESFFTAADMATLKGGRVPRALPPKDFLALLKAIGPKI